MDLLILPSSVPFYDHFGSIHPQILVDQLVNEARLFENGALPRDDAYVLEEEEAEDDQESEEEGKEDVIDLIHDDEDDGDHTRANNNDNNNPLVRIRQYLDHTKALIDQGADFTHSGLSKPTELMYYYKSKKATSRDSLVEQEQPNAVFVSTVQQAKGLEWPVVFVTRFNEGDFPCIWTENDNRNDGDAGALAAAIQLIGRGRPPSLCAAFRCPLIDDAAEDADDDNTINDEDEDGVVRREQAGWG